MRVTDGLASDVRLSARRLATTPLFTIFAILSLAVGVGVTTAVYSVVDAIFLRDTGVDDPDRVVFVVTPYDGRFLKGSISAPDFQDLRQSLTSVRMLSASLPLRWSVGGETTAEVVAGEAVDGSYFPALGVKPALGRFVQAEDDAANSDVVVLSDALWRRRFAADPAIVGRTVRLSGKAFEVVGVAPSSFEGATGGVPGTRFWTRLQSARPLTARHAAAASREERTLLVFGRLAAGKDVQAASAELHGIAASLDAAYPGPRRNMPPSSTDRPWRAKSLTAITADDNILRRFGIILLGLVALVLVVACTNLANLVLARGIARQSDFAVRAALGAPRWRLIREQCVESALVAIGGALASWLVFQLLRVGMTTEFALTLPFGGTWTLFIQPRLDAAALAFAAAATLLSLLVFGLEPTLQLTRSRDLRADLAPRASGGGAPRRGRQRTLLRWQVAISAGFFIIATMFVKYTVAESRHDSGVELEQLGIATLSLQSGEWDAARIRRTQASLLRELQGDPAVSSASASSAMPFGTGGALRALLSLPGAATHEPRHRGVAIGATASLFKTAGVAILQGRGFDERDHAASAPVAVISELTARQVFGSSAAVGRPMAMTAGLAPRIVTVIGVARDTDVVRMLDDRQPLVYLPIDQVSATSMIIGARSIAGAAAAVRALRGAVRRTDPDLPIEAIGPARAMLTGPYLFLRAAGIAALALGALTLLLAMVGLYGIQSHLVTYRTPEIGVRLSLGASATQIHRMVLRDGQAPVIQGLAIGMFLGLAGRAIVRSYLDITEMSIVDPWMVLIVPVPLVLAAIVACYLPARRAAAVDPSVALRHL